MPPRLEAVQPVLMVRDVASALRFYARIGFECVFVDSEDELRYAGVRRDGVELHLQWHDAAEWEPPIDRPTYRFVVQDVDGLHEEFVEAGLGEECTEVMSTAWGTREFHLQDPDRNGLQFYRDQPA